MSSIAPLMSLVQDFGDRVEAWPPARLLVWEPIFRRDCAAATVEVGRVCEVQADEILALALARSFCVNEVFTELLCKRYGAKMAVWFDGHARKAGLPQNPDRTEELIQDLWCQVAAGRMRNYNPRKSVSFGQYLYVATRNLFSSRVFRIRKSIPLNVLDEKTSGDTVMKDIAWRETEQQMRRALSGLPQLERQVVELTMEGMSSEAIAAAVGLSVARMFQVRFRARRLLEQKLGL